MRKCYHEPRREDEPCNPTTDNCGDDLICASEGDLFQPICIPYNDCVVRKLVQGTLQFAHSFDQAKVLTKQTLKGNDATSDAKITSLLYDGVGSTFVKILQSQK